MLSFKCGNLTHRENNCPNSSNYWHAAVKRIEPLRQKKTPIAVHLVLENVCSEMEAERSRNDGNGAVN